MTFMSCPRCGGTCYEGQDRCNQCRDVELPDPLDLMGILKDFPSLDEIRGVDIAEIREVASILRKLSQELETLMQEKCDHKNITTSFAGYGEHEVICNDRGKQF